MYPISVLKMSKAKKVGWAKHKPSPPLQKVGGGDMSPLSTHGSTPMDALSVAPGPFVCLPAPCLRFSYSKYENLRNFSFSGNIALDKNNEVRKFGI